MFSKQKAVIFFTVLVDAIGIGIVIPVLPFYVESFGASPFVITSLFAVFSFCSFLSAPFLGSLSDKYGRRPVLIISILSTALGWLVFASAKHMGLLFLGRIIDGMAAGNYSTAQSYSIDIAKTDKERTHNLGLTSAAFGLGFILGPMFGAFLSPVSKSFPFWFVGCLALFNALLAVLLIPETNKNKKEGKIKWNPLSPIENALKNKFLRPSFAMWFLFELSANSVVPILALYLKYIFGFGSVMAGIFMTFVGIIVVLNQAAFLKHFWLKYFSEKDLQFWLFLALFAGFLIMVVPKLLWFVIGLAVAAFCSAILRAVMASSVAGNGGNSRRGELMGILSSLGSVATIAGPLIAGAVFQIKASVPFYLAAIFAFVAFLILLIPQKSSLYGNSK